MPKDQLVYVEWEDSRGCADRWQEIDRDDAPRALVCKSVGWITRQSESCIVLTPNVASDHWQGIGDMTIPRRAILRTVPLSVPRKKA